MNTTTSVKQDCQILVANDCPQNLDLLHCILRNWGYQSCSATSARHAISKVELESFKLVIIDKLMPDMSGYRLAHRIKQIDRELPILCLNWGASPSTDLCTCHEHTFERPQNFKEVVKRAVKSNVHYDIVHL